MPLSSSRPKAEKGCEKALHPLCGLRERLSKETDEQHGYRIDFFCELHAPEQPPHERSTSATKRVRGTTRPEE